MKSLGADDLDLSRSSDQFVAQSKRSGGDRSGGDGVQSSVSIR